MKPREQATRRELFGLVAGLAGLAGLAVLGKGQPPAPRFEPVLWPNMKAASELNRVRAAWSMVQTSIPNGGYAVTTFGWVIPDLHGAVAS